jgi:hypothetical protein
MAKAKDLVEQKFGRLTVKYRVKTNKKGVYWYCECECGGNKEVLAANLKNGNVQSCGCLHSKIMKNRINDLKNKKFGKLTVIKRAENYIKPSGESIVQWICDCDCGNKNIIVSSGHLQSGHTQSCGCLKKIKVSEAQCANLIGMKFGRLTVKEKLTKRGHNQSVQWLCECECGNTTILVSSLLIGDIVKSCGCLSREKASLRHGDKHPNWKGDKDLKEFLRNWIDKWQEDSIKQCNDVCMITNKKFHNIHHLYPFHKIVEETLENLKLPIYNNVGQYKNEELKTIINECLRLHYKYGLGVCLNKRLHVEFHKKYGKINFTPEDFYEFYKDKTGRDFNLFFMYNFNNDKEVV